MIIELLYIEGCPSWQNGLENLKIALREEETNALVSTIKVKDNDHAARLKFLGSPSFRIDGKDLWPEERPSYSISCRIYKTPAGLKGWPSVAMLREKILAVKGDPQ